MKVPLKWLGKKDWLFDVIDESVKSTKATMFVDLFAGSLASSIDIEIKEKLANDINPSLIGFYKHIQSGLITSDSFDGLRYDEAAYYEYRQRYNQLIKEGLSSSLEASCLYFYFNRVGFRGISRFNKKGEFNVPYGHYKKPMDPHSFDWNGLRERFDSYQFTNVHFSDVAIKPNSLIYADPPYDESFTSYFDAFDFNEHVKLAKNLAESVCPVIASNKATDKIMNLYHSLGFNCLVIPAPRRLRKDLAQVNEYELLITKNIDFSVIKKAVLQMAC